jgi:hypothetical protein
VIESPEWLRLTRRIDGLAVAHCYRAEDLSTGTKQLIVNSFAQPPKHVLILGSKEDVLEFSNSAEDFSEGFYQHI